MHAQERTIAETAGRQDNVITREQLLALGLGRDLAGTEGVWATEEALSEARTQALVTDRQLLSVIERAPTRRG